MANFLMLLTVVLAVCSGAAMAVLTPRLHCQDVYGNFSACVPYIEEVSPYLSPKCCSGINMLNHVSKTENGGRRRICLCIENYYENGVHPFSNKRIKHLSYRCRIRPSFIISESANCSALHLDEELIS